MNASSLRLSRFVELYEEFAIGADVHDIEFAPSIDVVINETLPALESLRQAGIIHYIGVTGYPLNTLNRSHNKHTSPSSQSHYTNARLVPAGYYTAAKTRPPLPDCSLVQVGTLR
ncbi:hypothetical protein HPB51_020167 [Rhipicephalus microplus]|uniref:Uncharacterized protein n=1 Tax=Rhipicephalus microplus TaxID=6941 RepID=A0A9J6D6V3_RHIMP|nr:hypothetical protein HPB51_020167 [Rhipicephalus microplus]